MLNSPDLEQYRPAPLWPWLVASAIFFVSGLYLLRPEPASPYETRTSITRPTPTPGQTSAGVNQELEIPNEQDTLRFVCVDSPQSSFAKAMEVFQKDVDRATQGRVKIEICSGGMVGNSKLDELGIVQGLRQGKISLGLVTCSPLSNISPRMEVMDLPFLFRDYAHADAVLQGPTGHKIMDSLRGSGLVGLGSLEVGFRIFSSNQPIRKLEDFQHKKMRVMQSAASISMVRMVGGEAVPSPVDKIFQMAKEGYIDAADRTYPTYWDFRLYEVQKHIAETRHSYTIKVVLANETRWNQLRPEDRKAVMAAVDKIEVLQRKLQREEDQQVQEKCRTNGIEIHQFSAQDRGKLFKACEPLYSEYIKLHGRELLDEIKKNQGQPSAPENSIP